MNKVYAVEFYVEDRHITTWFKCAESDLDQKIGQECTRLMNVYKVNHVSWKTAFDNRVLAGGRILPATA